ncbi:hypothetical protein KSS87_023512 [Heliosperma pusillum]|nr:hypothetical protein KSS87_023512 [Heliosperma pusillum]
MDTLSFLLLLTSFSLLLFSDPRTAEATASFRMVNRCRYTVWPGLLSGATSSPLPTTGFTLKPGKSRTFTFPKSWSGRIWARTHCSVNSDRKFSCLTGDCASGVVPCGGAGAIPPATLAEFTLNGAGGLDFYDVSLVDGYNLPMLVVARGGHGGDCSPTGCLVDINEGCPRGLSVMTTRGNVSNSADIGTVVACKSACEAFGNPEFCCSEAFSTPDTCHPSVYSNFFKQACPRSYSYAYDDKTSTFTCASADYLIVFCPPPYTRSIVEEIRSGRFFGRFRSFLKSLPQFRYSS